MRMKGVRASGEELGVQGEMEVAEVATDSSAAKSFASRRGLGRMRHVEVRWLWLQAEVAIGRVKVLKSPGDVNHADVGTKYLTAGDIQSKLASASVDVEPKEAPVQVDSVGSGDYFFCGNHWAACGRGGVSDIPQVNN